MNVLLSCLTCVRGFIASTNVLLYLEIQIESIRLERKTSVKSVQMIPDKFEL